MPYPDDHTPLLLLLVLAERHVAAGLQAHLVAAGFHDHRIVHHNVMAHVTHDGVRLTDLAEKAGISKQAMAELVAGLERLGYLSRSPDPRDGRAKLITFTDKGRGAVAAAMEAFQTMERQLGERMGATTLQALRRGLLETVRAGLAPPDGAARAAPARGRRTSRSAASRV